MREKLLNFNDLILVQMLRILCILFLSVSVKAQAVYKTPSGNKYHLYTCRMVNNVSEKISENQAIKSGLQPCKICRPRNIYKQGLGAPNKAKGKSNTRQCLGYSKSGKRCKHMTSIANGYCFQHNPD